MCAPRNDDSQIGSSEVAIFDWLQLINITSKVNLFSRGRALHNCKPIFEPSLDCSRDLLCIDAITRSLLFVQSLLRSSRVR